MVGGERDGAAARRPSLWSCSPGPSSLAPGVPLWFFLSLVGRGRCAQARGDAAAGPEGAQLWPPRRRRSCRPRLLVTETPGDRDRQARLASRRVEWRVSVGRGARSSSSGSVRRVASPPGASFGRGRGGGLGREGRRGRGARCEAGATKARAAAGPSLAPGTSGSFAGRPVGLLREGDSAESPSFLGDTSREAVSVEPSVALSAGGDAL